MQLTLLATPLVICRLAAGAELPLAALGSPWWSLTRTAHELSLVCVPEVAPAGVPQEGPWRALEVAGPLDFGLTGILAALAEPLAAAEISIFAISTFDTDYVLVREAALAEALRVLTAAGHRIAM